MSGPQPPDEIIGHYERIYDEATRLETGGDGTMEAIRTLEILGRYLPDPPARILDVGGGPGFYARRLTADGYEVHLIDPVPRHVEEASRETDDGPAPASACLGDARELGHPDASFDAVLLLGPLYHLTDRSDRLTALREAHRVVVPGGTVLAAAITRFASALDGLHSAFIDDPAFARMMTRDLTDGQHRNPTGDPDCFTTAFFHHPDELRSELADAGFTRSQVIAIEGISWVAGDLAERLADPVRREVVLDIIRRTEAQPSLMGVSPHLMGIARR